MENNLKFAFSHARKFGRVRASVAIKNARAAIASGKKFYGVLSAPYIGAPDKDGARFFESVDAAPFRHVGNVSAECGGRNGIWEKREGRGGWFTDDYQESTLQGVVFQLAGRKGVSRFVAGYIENDNGGVCINFRIMHESASDDNGATYCDGARDAAFTADSMAKSEAETQREYNTAWQAGSAYAERAELIAETRKEVLTILAERREARGEKTYPALCKALRATIGDMLETINEAREDMRALAQGVYDKRERRLLFWTGDANMRAAFCDGASLPAFPD